jgi:tetratricopeptide (TPR) repeat protein
VKKAKKIHDVTAQVREPRSAVVLSTPKKILFILTLIVAPVLLLVLAEVGLRAFNYGGNLDLFVLDKNGTEYVLNKNFTQRYFFQKGIETPIPLSQTFRAEKDSSTYRIFCLGESSVQGFPYQPNAAFPAMLKNILTRLHPGRNIEVVNCGITAISSFSILDMGEEILEKYHPDLLVLYAGHNEFYGVFGSASRLSFFENPAVINGFLKLQQAKVVLLARNVLTAAFGRDVSADPSLHRGTMMGIVARDVGIRLTDGLVHQTERTFKNNIESLVAAARAHNTEMVVCNLVSNVKDFSPFASLHAEALAEKDTTRWKAVSERAATLLDEKHYGEARDAFLDAVQIDSMYAETQYRLGQCYYALHGYDSAQYYFERAADLDVIRFRAPSSFNAIIKNVCADNRVPFVDVHGDFAGRSEHGIIGNELLLEHVHPNQQGYLQIAKSVAKTMSEYKLIESTWDWSRNLPDSAYYAMSHLTLLDREVVNSMLANLTSHWPYRPEHRKYAGRLGNDETERLAASFISRNGKNIVLLHLEYGTTLERQNKVDDAAAEYQAALAIQPVGEVYNRLGRLYLIQTEQASRDARDYTKAQASYQESERWFLAGLTRWPDDIELNLNLGILYMMRTDKRNEAESRLKNVLKMNPSHRNALALLQRLYGRPQ